MTLILACRRAAQFNQALEPRAGANSREPSLFREVLGESMSLLVRAAVAQLGYVRRLSTLDPHESPVKLHS